MNSNQIMCSNILCYICKLYIQLFCDTTPSIHPILVILVILASVSITHALRHHCLWILLPIQKICSYDTWWQNSALLTKSKPCKRYLRTWPHHKNTISVTHVQYYRDGQIATRILFLFWLCYIFKPLYNILTLISI
jgi:hypothetical protein